MSSNVDLEFFVVWVVGNWFRGLCNQLISLTFSKTKTSFNQI
jgi:hypothetical protein